MLHMHHEIHPKMRYVQSLMKLVVLTTFLVGMLWSNTVKACEHKPDSAKKKLQSIVLDLQHNKVNTIEIRYFPHDFEKFGGISTSDMELPLNSLISDKLSKRQFSVPVSNDVLRYTMRVFDHIELHDPHENFFDLRQRAKFLDLSGNTIHSIYVGKRLGSENTGYIDGLCVGINDKLFDWFEALISSQH